MKRQVTLRDDDPHELPSLGPAFMVANCAHGPGLVSRLLLRLDPVRGTQMRTFLHCAAEGLVRPG